MKSDTIEIRKYSYNGKVVYGFPWCTYGCLGSWETAVTDEPGKCPFEGVPTKDLVEVGKVKVPRKLDI